MSQYYAVVRNDNYLEHHGVKGMKWGVRRFQRADGTRTAAGLKRYAEGARSRIRSTVNRFKTDKKFRRRVALGAAAVGAAGLAAYGLHRANRAANPTSGFDAYYSKKDRAAKKKANMLSKFASRNPDRWIAGTMNSVGKKTARMKAKDLKERARSKAQNAKDAAYAGNSRDSMRALFDKDYRKKTNKSSSSTRNPDKWIAKTMSSVGKKTAKMKAKDLKERARSKVQNARDAEYARNSRNSMARLLDDDYRITDNIIRRKKKKYR